MRTEPETAPLPRDVVLLVHGTFAGREEFEGDAWWQQTSAFERGLSKRLGAGFECQPKEHAFAWENGPNSESERREAGRRLEQRLAELEADSRVRRYHFVAHSHGGSVVWAALRGTAGRGRHLAKLGGWVTIGTPFLRFEPEPPSPLLGLLVAGAGGALLADLPYLRVALEADALVGAFDATPLALILLGVAAVVPPLVLAIGLFVAIRWAAAMLRCRKEDRATVAAMGAYGGRWLGLCATQDEALAGLGNTLRMSFPVLPRRRQGPLGALAALYNGLLAPTGDEFVWRFTSRGLQGSDRPGYRLASVSPHPLHPLQPPALPLGLRLAEDAELVQRADGAAAHALSRVREAVGLAAVNGEGLHLLFGRLRSNYSGDELIHTAYFESDHVAALVADHLRKHASALPESVGSVESHHAAPRVPNSALPREGSAERIVEKRDAGGATAPERHHRLRVAVIGASSALLALSSLSVRALCEAAVWPYTAAFHASAAVERAPLQRTSTSDIDEVQTWFRALARLPAADDTGRLTLTPQEREDSTSQAHVGRNPDEYSSRNAEYRARAQWSQYRSYYFGGLPEAPWLKRLPEAAGAGRPYDVRRAAFTLRSDPVLHLAALAAYAGAIARSEDVPAGVSAAVWEPVVEAASSGIWWSNGADEETAEGSSYAALLVARELATSGEPTRARRLVRESMLHPYAIDSCYDWRSDRLRRLAIRVLVASGGDAEIAEQLGCFQGRLVAFAEAPIDSEYGRFVRDVSAALAAVDPARLQRFLSHPATFPPSTRTAPRVWADSAWALAAAAAADRGAADDAYALLSAVADEGLYQASCQAVSAALIRAGEAEAAVVAERKHRREDAGCYEPYGGLGNIVSRLDACSADPSGLMPSNDARCWGQYNECKAASLSICLEHMLREARSGEITDTALYALPWGWIALRLAPYDSMRSLPSRWSWAAGDWASLGVKVQATMAEVRAAQGSYGGAAEHLLRLGDPALQQATAEAVVARAVDRRELAELAIAMDDQGDAVRNLVIPKIVAAFAARGQFRQAGDLPSSSRGLSARAQLSAEAGILSAFLSGR